MRHTLFSQKALLGLLVGSLSPVLLLGCKNDVPVASKDKPSAPVTAAQKARRAVKTTTDQDAIRIAHNVTDTTIEDLVKNKPKGELGTRQEPFETSVWRVRATIESIEQKKDGDYYMVLRGEKGGQTVVEVPDPETCKGSPFEAEITATRKALEEKYHPTADKKEVNEPASITGVGFLGFGSKPKKGSSGFSGPRIMPGTDIHFDDSKAK